MSSDRMSEPPIPDVRNWGLFLSPKQSADQPFVFVTVTRTTSKSPTRQNSRHDGNSPMITAHSALSHSGPRKINGLCARKGNMR
jgi:hypothetical protein